MKTNPFVLILVSSLISAVISILLNFLPIEMLQAKMWLVSVGFHVVISLALGAILFRKTPDPKDFINKIMLTSMGRLLLCMVGVFIYSLIDKPHFVGFSAHFMLHYLIFTILEINYLLKFIKTQNHE